MKKISIVIFIFLILSGCQEKGNVKNESNVEKTSSQQDTEEIRVYSTSKIREYADKKFYEAVLYNGNEGLRFDKNVEYQNAVNELIQVTAVNFADEIIRKKDSKKAYDSFIKYAYRLEFLPKKTQTELIRLADLESNSFKLIGDTTNYNEHLKELKDRFANIVSNAKSSTINAEFINDIVYFNYHYRKALSNSDFKIFEESINTVFERSLKMDYEIILAWPIGYENVSETISDIIKPELLHSYYAIKNENTPPYLEEITIGMSESKVINILGEPQNIIETQKENLIEKLYVYTFKSKLISFENGKVEMIQTAY